MTIRKVHYSDIGLIFAEQTGTASYSLRMPSRINRYSKRDRKKLLVDIKM